MSQAYFEDSMIKFLSGEISDEEKSKLVDWLRDNPEQIKAFHDTKKIWHLARLYSDENAANEAYREFTNLRDKKKLETRLKNSMVFFTRIAAIFLILFSFAVGYVVIKNQRMTNKAGQYVTTHVPNGEKGQVILSDGTKVWLNSGSSLTYPSGFSKKKRDVYLAGEGYFDVEKDKKRPFLVHAGDLTIKVLGTEFNVKCYRNDDQIKTTLIEGSIQILGNENVRIKENLTLKKNETANYSRSEKKITIEQVLVKEPLPEANNFIIKKQKKEISEVGRVEPIAESITSWKNNKLIFDNEMLSEMVKKMERWYGVAIVIEDNSLENNIYSGKFVYNESIERVLDILGRTTPIEYEINKDTIIIRSSE